jgi:hypothetical protein
MICAFLLPISVCFVHFCENNISSTAYFIYMNYVFTTIKQLNISNEKCYCFYVWVYSCGRSCGTIWRRGQWTYTLLSTQILQKHLDRRNSPGTLKSFTRQDRNWDAEQRANSCPLSYGKMFSVIIDTWCKYFSLRTWFNKKRQINDKI